MRFLQDYSRSKKTVLYKQWGHDVVEGICWEIAAYPAESNCRFIDLGRYNLGIFMRLLQQSF